MRSQSGSCHGIAGGGCPGVGVLYGVLVRLQYTGTLPTVHGYILYLFYYTM